MTIFALTHYNSGMPNRNDGLQVRYVELRFDGNNVIEGTLMRYGDTATLPWNEKETVSKRAHSAATLPVRIYPSISSTCVIRKSRVLAAQA